MWNEEQNVHEIMQDIQEGDNVASGLKYDPQTKTIRPASSYEDPDRCIVVTPRDMEHFGACERWIL